MKLVMLVVLSLFAELAKAGEGDSSCIFVSEVHAYVCKVEESIVITADVSLVADLDAQQSHEALVNPQVKGAKVEAISNVFKARHEPTSAH